jgi:ketosteroid isomerase-like protein
MGISDNKKIAEAFYDAGNRGDMDTCFGFLADDIVWTSVGTTAVSGRYSGKDELIEKLLGPVFGELKAGIFSAIDNIIAEGDCVVVQSRGIAETKDGRPYNNTYCHIMKIRDGRIAELTEFCDTELTSSVYG